MIQVSNLTKSFGDRVLIEGASFSVNRGEKVGLVGKNGHGKSTLFRMFCHEESYDDGSIHVPQQYRIGKLSQYFNFDADTVIDEACKALPKNDEGWDESYKAETILGGLGFDDMMMQGSPQSLSGGYQMRLNLTQLLLSEPDMLLLDEPTNYLDIISIQWLKQFLKQWKGEFILITHDREFMDSICTSTLGIHRKKMRKIEGGTHKFYSQLAEEEEIHEKTRLNEEAKRAEVEKFVERFRAKASKATAVQSRVKMLEKQDALDKIEAEKDLNFSFRESNFSGRRFLDVEGAEFGYTPDKILFSNLNFELFPGDRLAVVGKNGKGKSTLLRLLEGELKPVSGLVKSHDHLKTGYFGQTNVDRLSPENTVADEVLTANPEMSLTEVRGICGLMMFEGDNALKNISVLSGGEKSRVLLGKILACPVNVLLLDEPTHHLDMQSVDSLVQAVEEFSGAVVIVTHSESLVERLANKLVIFDEGECKFFDGGYKEFKERVGWSFERKANPSSKEEKPKPQSGANRKELRQKKAELVQERSKALGPLKKQVQGMEAEIATLETNLEAANNDLLKASEEGDPEKITELSKSVNELESKLEECLDSYYVASEELEEKEKAYEEKISDLENQL